MVNNEDNRVFMSWNYRSDSCPLKFYFLVSYNHEFALETSLLGQICIIRMSNFRGATASADSSLRSLSHYVNRLGCFH